MPLADGLRVFSITTKTGRGFGKRMLFLRLEDTNWKPIGELGADYSVKFIETVFKKWTPEQLQRLRENVTYIAEHPEECFRAYEQLEEEREQLKKENKAHGS